jgi:serine phosphatase RsbU (regulator of sigma subunit)
MHQLEFGDLLLATSDGLIEQAAAHGDRFESELHKMSVPAEASAELSLTKIMAHFEQFRAGGEQLDDISAVALRVGRAASTPAPANLD